MISIYNDNFTKEPLISPLCEGFAYGNGFFTTIKVKNRFAENLDLHIKRIKDSLIFFNFNFNIPDFKSLIDKLFEINKVENGRVKITIFKDIDKISYLIIVYSLIETKEPVSLKISKYSRGDAPIFRYKSLNYLTNLESSQIIFHDSKSRILETGSANIFCMKDKKLYTPPLTLPILPGTYRQYLLNKGSYNGYEISEKEIFIHDLKDMDGVFVSNSIKGMLKVKNIGSIYYG